MKIECEINGVVCSDELDKLPLSHRRNLLLSKRPPSQPHPPLSPPPGFHVSSNGSDVAKRVETVIPSNVVVSEKDERLDSQSLKTESEVNGDTTDNLDHIVLKERLRLLLSRNVKSRKEYQEESNVELNPCDKPDDCPSTTHSESNSSLLNLVQVKAEPLETSECVKKTCALDNLTIDDLIVKKEYEVSLESLEDNLDYLPLQSRINFQKTWGSEFDSFGRGNSTGECEQTTSETFQRIRLPRKRKKTATDSIETALDEDAPGLLQVLVEHGVSPDEMKLYGETESDEPIDESFCEDSFSELESVISKLFLQRNSFLKVAAIHCTKVSKPTYCLGCLFSLVEQTRYLQFRNWPAEWGWCRELQSFIFVFRNHRRIVLERPEYGYATYFFELVDSLPIDWQIKRLVIAMKLTNCGRISLIENKALLVGKDVSEGEAKVLMQYGWTPNTGLGTMLNYYDRVYHDRKNEKEISEWRSKIGKLLMDGYTGGTLLFSRIQTNDAECSSFENSEIKMELE